MPVGEICNRQVVFVTRDTSVVDAAKLMREHHVGDVVVVEEDGERRVPVGIVTDRDIVLEVIAEEVWVGSLSAGDIMGPELVTARETDGVLETLKRMRMHGVRRVPVVDATGGLAGILAADDVVELLSLELSELSRLTTRQVAREERLRG